MMSNPAEKHDCTCNSHKRLTVNAILRRDPTFTLTLRKAFVAAMEMRFNGLKRDIRVSIVDNDCFGLTTPERRLSFQEALETEYFRFARSDDKIKGFMAWLEAQEKAGVLEITTRFGTGGIEGAWTDTYIQTAYQKGIIRARKELKKAGRGVAEPGQIPGGMATVFNQPIHADRLGLLYTRTFNELKGVTESMNQGISRVLAQGIAEGKNPRTIARELNDRVDKIGKHRARILARTEVIRAHHVATIQEYKLYGIEGVKVKAEWLTAGFNVCPQCEDLEAGGPYTLEKIEPMIPRHPL